MPNSVPEYPSEDGAWLVYLWDWNVIAQSIHLTELEALRRVEQQGYGNVAFLPYGTDVSEAIK